MTPARDKTLIVDPNLPDQTTRAKLYPQFARVNFWTSTSDNSYRALLLKVEKRMSNRYQFLVSYTFSKALDTQATNLLAEGNGIAARMPPLHALEDEVIARLQG